MQARTLSFLSISLGLMAFFGHSEPAYACGGFFCDSVTMQPVDQAGERILFHVDEINNETTTFVEITYEGNPDQFAWVLPVDSSVQLENVTTASPDLMQDLATFTSPQFQFIAPPRSTSRGCSAPTIGCSNSMILASGDEWGPGATPSSVDVVGQVQVGPFAIEQVRSTSATALNDWLVLNGYDLPPEAAEPLAHYIDLGMDFLGVRLIPEEITGVIDTLVFTATGIRPQIPIILTQIAAVEDMPVIAYVLADVPYRPENYAEIDFDYDAVEPDFSTGGTTYVPRLQNAIFSAGGQAFVTEFGGPTEFLVESTFTGVDTADILGRAPYLTRFRTYISPSEMTLDPRWRATPGAPDVSNVHLVQLAAAQPRTGASPIFFALVPMLMLLQVRRRRIRSLRH